MHIKYALFQADSHTLLREEKGNSNLRVGLEYSFHNTLFRPRSHHNGSGCGLRAMRQGAPRI